MRYLLLCLSVLTFFTCGPKPEKPQEEVKKKPAPEIREPLLNEGVQLFSLPKTRTADELYQTVAAHMGGIQYCYQKNLDAIGKGKGQVIVEFVITTGGDVKNVEVIETFANVPEFLTCIKEAVSRWKFDRIADDGDEPKVFYPFEFGY